jgi:hypothetical protein
MNELYTNSRDECHKDINELCTNPKRWIPPGNLGFD